jgi:chromosome segregation ATPase
VDVTWTRIDEGELQPGRVAVKINPKHLRPSVRYFMKDIMPTGMNLIMHTSCTMQNSRSENMEKWLTISEAVTVLGISERALREKVRTGKIESKLENRRRLVWVETDEVGESREHEAHHEPHHELLHEKDARIADLQQQVLSTQDQLVRRDEQIESLTEKMDHLTQVIAMAQKNVATLSDQLEGSRLQLEELQQPKSLWKRLLGK